MYESMDILNANEKHMFNALYLGVSLLLALNMVASFKTMADLFRWKVLASTTYGGHSAKELDLILGLSSYGTATILLKHWLRKPRYFFLLLFWIMLGIMAQAGLAMLGLTFNHDSEGAQKTSPGIVNATLLDSFHKTSPAIPMYFEQNYLAHLYGDMSYNMREHSEGEPLPPNVDPGLIDIIYVNATNEFKYYFKEFAWRPHGEPRWARTKRYVTVSPKCSWSPIIKGQKGDGAVVIDLDGDGSGIHPTEHSWITGLTGQSTTLYANPSINANETENMLLNATLGIDISTGKFQPTCGSRCGLTLVYRFIREMELVRNPLPFGDFFNCKTTISTVQNALQPQHHLADKLAVRIASAAGSNAIWIFDPNFTLQQTSYNSASRWDNWQGLSGKEATERAEYLVGRFAAGTIAMLDNNNPREEIPGQRPWEGVFLRVKWLYVWITFGILLGGQLLIGLVTMIKANTVFCKDSSFLSTARLLRPLVDRMGESGCAATGNEIAELFENTHMRYGVRRDGGYNRLDILMDITKVEGKFQGGVGFPRGYYE